ncbi:MAG: alpha/beta hydrolase [Candidatus Hydrogenedentes bacterium]|nr:alpha/beta hydrolase [Candidatus Hydrogenedentota bacterium]
MEPETFVYKTAQGCDIHADLYRAASTAPAPVVVWIHGGALIGGGREQMQPVLRRLLHESGFAQVSIDYRLAPETKLPEIIEDVRDALRWVREQGPGQLGINPASVAVLGGSAGGYLSLMCGCCVAPRPRAVVAFYGYGDIMGDWYSRPDPFYCAQPAVPEDEARKAVGTACISNQADKNDRFRFYLWCRQHGLWPREAMGVDPHKRPKAFKPYCPLQNVSKEYPPTLLLHGTGDTDVPYQQSADMAMALQTAGVPHELITIEDGPHGFDGRVKEEDLNAPEQSAGVRALYKVVQFLAAYG